MPCASNAHMLNATGVSNMFHKLSLLLHSHAWITSLAFVLICETCQNSRTKSHIAKIIACVLTVRWAGLPGSLAKRLQDNEESNRVESFTLMFFFLKVTLSGNAKVYTKYKMQAWKRWKMMSDFVEKRRERETERERVSGCDGARQEECVCVCC